MNAGNYSKVETGEQERIFNQERFSVTENAGDEPRTIIVQNSMKKDDVLFTDNVDLDKNVNIQHSENLKNNGWRKRELCTNKSLLPLRFALFFWFASGMVFSPFFSLLLTHRGLKLTDFSTIFSLMFLFQLKIAYICGIIADKIGNAKPVMLFLMISAVCTIIGLLLSPDVREESCSERNANVTCLTGFNLTTDLEYCEHICSRNNTGYFILETETNINGLNISLNKIDALYYNESFGDIFSLNRTITFCNEICSCVDHFAKNCPSVSKTKFKIIYSILLLFFFSFWSTSYRFLDFASVNVAKKYDSDFGNERLFGVWGALVATILCNFVLNIDKSGAKDYYDNVYWVAVALCVIAIISACNIRDVQTPPGINFTKNTLKMLTDIEIASVLCVAFAAGLAKTFSYFFDLWFLNSLNASKTNIGVHLISIPLYAVPVYATSTWWLKKLGRKKLIIIGLLCSAISGTCFSFLYNPWLSILIEITKVFSSHLFWIALVVHCQKIAPKGFSATINAVMGTIHFGIGRSVSVATGGYLISTYGARTTYRILATFCLVIAILYSLFLFLRYLYSKRESQKRRGDPEEMKGMRENEA